MFVPSDVRSMRTDDCATSKREWKAFKRYRLHTESTTIIARNSIFDSHFSPVGRKMAIENSVSNDFYLVVRFLSTFVNNINVFDCRLSGVVKAFTYWRQAIGVLL